MEAINYIARIRSSVDLVLMRKFIQKIGISVVVYIVNFIKISAERLFNSCWCFDFFEDGKGCTASSRNCGLLDKLSNSV